MSKVNPLSPFMTRETEQEKKPAEQERIRCRCEKCGKVIYVQQGYERICIFCLAEEKRSK